MNSIDQEFVEFVVKSLVSKPDQVSIERRIDEKGVLLELTVDPEDLGRVIGKRGATAQSLRTLLRALGTKNDARYNLKIVDNGVGDYSHASSDNSGTSDDVATAAPSSAASAAETDVIEDVQADESPILEEDQPSSRLTETRKELEELDDLDV